MIKITLHMENQDILYNTAHRCSGQNRCAVTALLGSTGKYVSTGVMGNSGLYREHIRKFTRSTCAADDRQQVGAEPGRAGA